MKSVLLPFAAPIAIAAAVTSGTHLRAQMRCPASVVAGGVITVDVASSAGSVQVTAGGPATSSHPVPPSKRVDIPVPPVPPGTVLLISIGRGLRRHCLLVEVVAP